MMCFQLGRPVNIQSFGAMSAKRLYRHITPEEHWRTVLVNVESLLAEVLPAASAAAGRPIRQVLVIIDLKGFGLAQFWALKSIARRSFEISQSFFPETYVRRPSSSMPPSLHTQHGPNARHQRPSILHRHMDHRQTMALPTHTREDLSTRYRPTPRRPKRPR
jgi:hypothetical protein